MRRRNQRADFSPKAQSDSVKKKSVSLFFRFCVFSGQHSPALFFLTEGVIRAHDLDVFYKSDKGIAPSDVFSPFFPFLCPASPALLFWIEGVIRAHKLDVFNKSDKVIAPSDILSVFLSVLP